MNDKDYPTAQMKELFAAILTLETLGELTAFFRDLLTIAELTEFSNRWQIVKRLVQKESYSKIAKELNVSTATVTRVAHWFHDGMGGYRLATQRSTKK